MKTIRLKKWYSRRERRAIARKANALFAKQHSGSSVIMMAVIIRLIKGKLGIDMFTPDGQFVNKAKAIHANLLANAGGFYTPPFSLLATILTQVATLEAEMLNVENRVVGSEGARTAAKLALKITLDAALGYVNQIAKLDQTNAVQIITGASMEVINRGPINKQDFTVVQGMATGEVILRSLAARNVDGKYVAASYSWQTGIDGIIWTDLPDTVAAKLVVTGLPVDTKTYFRKRVTTSRGGTTAWCNAIGITVV